ncbi:MAG TPA: hypothetical protein VGM90_17630 [Kofleriaceae bacterium]
MRFALVSLLLVAACSGDDGSSAGDDGSGARPPVSAECEGVCVVDSAPSSWQDCCDSTTCYFDETTNHWQKVSCDPPADPCVLAGCSADEVCVQTFNGTCGDGSAYCVAKTVDCPLTGACSPECQHAYCGDSVYQCQDRAPCGTESPSAFTCYGP